MIEQFVFFLVGFFCSLTCLAEESPCNPPGNADDIFGIGGCWRPPKNEHLFWDGANCGLFVAFADSNLVQEINSPKPFPLTSVGEDGWNWEELKINQVFHFPTGLVSLAEFDLEPSVRSLGEEWSSFRVQGNIPFRTLAEGYVDFPFPASMTVNEFCQWLAFMSSRIVFYIPCENGPCFLAAGHAWTAYEPVLVHGRIDSMEIGSKKRSWTMRRLSRSGKTKAVVDFVVGPDGRYMAIVPIPADARTIHAFPKHLFAEQSRDGSSVMGLIIDCSNGKSVTNLIDFTMPFDKFESDFQFFE
ncbi:MAG: hypothetical protein IJ678_03070 [Kiritimatiellae bacterium]|nr:hypothetical protein [Kiritimatiellia bacterium]